jgi:hypothetical protein
MARLWAILFAGILTLSGAVPVGAQFVSIGSSLSVHTAAGAPASVRAGATADTPTSAGATAQVNESVVDLPCIPVAAYWTGPPQSDGMPPGPDLAIVSTKVRPKNARVHLDGRFAGRARYLDGNPGYLYLEPGSYRLEIRYDGYRTVVVELDVAAGCRYDLKHYMERVKGTPKEGKGDRYGKGKPFDRVFAPLQKDEEVMASVPAQGPDPSLRHDLTPDHGQTGDTQRKVWASLHIRVDPTSASVSIDGDFVATGNELRQMENPLAMTPGAHLIEVEAPGFMGAVRNIVLKNGEMLELVITLSRVERD